uniref:DUF2067 domain-containing protein n=1 Tax=Thermofilum adornatum TaxID=1365176 RepID=A0A7C1CDQ4_9CREN
MRGITLTLNFDTPEEAISFLKLITSRIKYSGLYGEIKGKKLKLFIPENQRTEEVVNEVKTLYRELHGAKNAFQKKRFKIQTVLSLAKLETAIPVPVLVDIIKLQGKHARLAGETIETSLELNELVRLAEQVSSAYHSAIHMTLTSSARRLLVVASLTLGKNPEETVSLLLSRNLLREEDGTLSLSMDYERSIEKLRELVKQST